MANEVEILLVEDSLTQALQLKKILTSLGFIVTHASDGHQALAALRQQRPGLVLSDIVMPEIDGYQLCRQIKEDPEFGDLPIILMTTMTDSHEVVRALENKADGFITKPCDPAFLSSRIETALANRQLRGTSVRRWQETTYRNSD